jgi:ubiquinone biosynthesis monooxygenase Coq7
MTDPRTAIAPTLDFDTMALPSSLIADLRSDHAGEVGAVMIYRGILAVARDPEVRDFAHRHLKGEQQHLAFFDGLLPNEYQSRSLPVWRLAGWAIGALPALAGPGAVYLTIDAVETFVDSHYADQVERMATDGHLNALRAVLESFRRDEAAHRDDAASRRLRRTGPLGRGWRMLVGLGSGAGVALARRL